MAKDDAALTRVLRAAVDGPGAIPYLLSVITVAGEHVRVRAMRLILTRARPNGLPGDLCRSRHVYKLCSMGPSTSPSWMRKNSRAATRGHLMEASATLRLSSLVPSTHE